MNKVLANEKWIYQAYATDCGQLTIAELGLYLLLLTKVDTRIGFTKTTLTAIATRTNLDNEQVKSLIQRLIDKNFIFKRNGNRCTEIHFIPTNALMQLYGTPETFPCHVINGYKPTFNYEVTFTPNIVDDLDL